MQPVPCVWRGLQSLALKDGELPAVEEEVLYDRTGAVAALDQGRARRPSRRGAARRAHARRGCRSAGRQRLGLGQVGRDQRRQGQQLLAQGVEGVSFEEPIAPFGDHHRIEHHGEGAELAQGGSDAAHDLSRAEHADLHRIDADVGGDHLDLPLDGLEWQRPDAEDAQGVLGGHGGDGGHAVAAQALDRLQIGLDAGAAARVAAGDGQDPGRPSDWFRRVHRPDSMALAEGRPEGVGTGVLEGPLALGGQAHEAALGTSPSRR